jgi:hypothetical protein
MTDAGFGGDTYSSCRIRLLTLGRQFMKVFLRHTSSGLFYAGPDRWTQGHVEAMNFEAPNLALDMLSESKLDNMEVVIHFEQTPFHIPVKVVGRGG